MIKILVHNFSIYLSIPNYQAQPSPNHSTGKVSEMQYKAEETKQKLSGFICRAQKYLEVPITPLKAPNFKNIE